jgi:hypothetical protein
MGTIYRKFKTRTEGLNWSRDASQWLLDYFQENSPLIRSFNFEALAEYREFMPQNIDIDDNVMEWEVSRTTNFAVVYLAQSKDFTSRDYEFSGSAFIKDDIVAVEFALLF